MKKSRFNLCSLLNWIGLFVAFNPIIPGHATTTTDIRKCEVEGDTTAYTGTACGHGKTKIRQRGSTGAMETVCATVVCEDTQVSTGGSSDGITASTAKVTAPSWQAPTPTATTTSDTDSSSGTVTDSCFAAGTRIVMADGSLQPIETIRVGDQVLGFDGQERVSVRVSHVFMHGRSRGPLLLNLSNGTELEVTSEHPFFTGEGYTEAGDLSENSTVFTWEGETLSPLRISAIKALRGPSVVYNIETELTHNYFAEGILVHNKQTTTETPAALDTSSTDTATDPATMESPDGDSGTGTGL